MFFVTSTTLGGWGGGGGVRGGFPSTKDDKLCKAGCWRNHVSFNTQKPYTWTFYSKTLMTNRSHINMKLEKSKDFLYDLIDFRFSHGRLFLEIICTVNGFRGR